LKINLSPEQTHLLIVNFCNQFCPKFNFLLPVNHKDQLKLNLLKFSGILVKISVITKESILIKDHEKFYSIPSVSAAVNLPVFIYLNISGMSNPQQFSRE
jgi:hypothetical protein